MLRLLMLMSIVLLLPGCMQSDKPPDQKPPIQQPSIEEPKDDNDGKQAEKDEVEIGYVTIEDLKVGDLSVYMSFDEVTGIMGQELKKESVTGLEDENAYTLHYEDGTVIQMHNDQVYSVEVVTNGYPTHRGLKVGDSTERALELYGAPTYKKAPEWNYTTEDDYMLFTLYVENDKVVKIRVNLVM